MHNKDPNNDQSWNVTKAFWTSCYESYQNYAKNIIVEGNYASEGGLEKLHFNMFCDYRSPSFHSLGQ